MHGLTYGVIRVDSEEKLSVLTVQDVGLVMPGGKELSLKLTMIHQFKYLAVKSHRWAYFAVRQQALGLEYVYLKTF